MLLISIVASISAGDFLNNWTEALKDKGSINAPYEIAANVLVPNPSGEQSNVNINYPSLPNVKQGGYRAVGKFGENVEKRQTSKGRKELAWDRAKATAKKRHETFKKDRKIKDKSQKSYNKGRKDQVDSAYERRQKDADTAMRNAARKRHDEWQKKNKRGKYRVSKK